MPAQPRQQLAWPGPSTLPLPLLLLPPPLRRLLLLLGKEAEVKLAHHRVRRESLQVAALARAIHKGRAAGATHV